MHSNLTSKAFGGRGLFVAFGLLLCTQLVVIAAFGTEDEPWVMQLGGGSFSSRMPALVDRDGSAYLVEASGGSIDKVSPGGEVVWSAPRENRRGFGDGPLWVQSVALSSSHKILGVVDEQMVSGYIIFNPYETFSSDTVWEYSVVLLDAETGIVLKKKQADSAEHFGRLLGIRAANNSQDDFFIDVESKYGDRLIYTTAVSSSTLLLLFNSSDNDPTLPQTWLSTNSERLPPWIAATGEATECGTTGELDGWRWEVCADALAGTRGRNETTWKSVIGDTLKREPQGMCYDESHGDWFDPGGTTYFYSVTVSSDRRNATWVYVVGVSCEYIYDGDGVDTTAPYLARWLAHSGQPLDLKLPKCACSLAQRPLASVLTFVCAMCAVALCIQMRW